MRIDKLLSNMGIGSRKEVKEYIKKGMVLVNGIVVKKATDKVDENHDKITFNNEDLIYEKYTYIMMNKPQGVISASEGYTQETVIDLLDERYHNRGMFPAGRLDKDTEGLVLLTNDGRLAHSILSPKRGVTKKYYAKVDQKLDQEDIVAFNKGIYLEKEQYMTRPADLEILSEYECFVFIEEGKYHQVKRMLSSRGKNVTYLKRLAIGPLVLDETLELGEYRDLLDDELEKLKNINKSGGIMTDEKRKSLLKEEVEDKQVEAETSQRAVTTNDKPSSDVYTDVEKREEETGIEVPTEEAVEEAREWSEENQM